MPQNHVPYRIALVNHADPNNPEHWLNCDSNVRSKALEQTIAVLHGAKPVYRQNRRVNPGNVQLFHFIEGKQPRRVPLNGAFKRMQAQVAP